MKTIIRIARLEISILFYSPIAWFLLIIFLFQGALSYTSNLENYVLMQDMGGYKDRLTFLTDKVFGQSFAMLSEIMGKAYLYLPLLTMGLMSREMSSGTIKLLYSSPIKISQIIFGKFLSMMIYILLLTLVLSIFIIAGCFNISHADCGQLLAGMLGFYLLLCTYAAIGLFMSCLTSYQVVAALSTFVIFALLEYIGTVWQEYNFVRDLTYALSISGRAETMVNGLISTKDVFYFLIIIYIFLGLSILKLRAGRESKSNLVNFSRYAALLVSAIVISYMASRPVFTAYYDVTATKTQTLTENTQKIMREIGDSTLQVTSYVNLLDGRYYYGQPTERNTDMGRWEPYLRFKPDIKFKYVYYYDTVPNPRFYKANPGKTTTQIAEAYAKSFGFKLGDFKSPAEMAKLIDLKPEQNRYVMQLKYKGKATFLRLYDDRFVFPSETETSAAIKRMLIKLPKIAFLQGELERSTEKSGDQSYQTLTSDITFRYALVNQGFDVEYISLKNDEIPKDIAALVIADPRTAFGPAVLAKIQKYIAAGGNLLIAGEPGKQAILNPIIQPLGVQLMDGMIVQPGKDFGPDMVFPFLTSSAGAFSKSVMKNFKDSVPISMPGAAGLSYNAKGAYHIKPLLITDGKVSWAKKGRLVLDSADITYSPQEGDVKMPVATALSLTRNINGREQRIVVTGDADFLSNAEVNRKYANGFGTCNFSFGTAIFGWLSYGQFPIDSTRPGSRDNHVNITGHGFKVMKFVFVWVLPAIVLIAGAILLLRRKRK